MKRWRLDDKRHSRELELTKKKTHIEISKGEYDIVAQKGGSKAFTKKSQSLQSTTVSRYQNPGMRLPIPPILLFRYIFIAILPADSMASCLVPVVFPCALC